MGAMIPVIMPSTGIIVLPIRIIYFVKYNENVTFFVREVKVILCKSSSLVIPTGIEEKIRDAGILAGLIEPSAGSLLY